MQPGSAARRWMKFELKMSLDPFADRKKKSLDRCVCQAALARSCIVTPKAGPAMAVHSSASPRSHSVE